MTGYLPMPDRRGLLGPTVPTPEAQRAAEGLLRHAQLEGISDVHKPRHVMSHYESMNTDELFRDAKPQPMLRPTTTNVLGDIGTAIEQLSKQMASGLGAAYNAMVDQMILYGSASISGDMLRGILGEPGVMSYDAPTPDELCEMGIHDGTKNCCDTERRKNAAARIPRRAKDTP